MMDSQLLQFLGSLAAVAAVVVLTHFLGFTRGGNISDEAEARTLFQLAPGGFEPVEVALDADRRGAIARDEAGRIAVLMPHGGQFIARALGGDMRCCVEGERLAIEDSALGQKSVALNLGDAAQHWASPVPPAR